MSRRTELALLALVLAGAAALRLLWLDLYPPGWHHDEALMGVMAAEVYHGVQRPIFFPGYAGQEPLYIYLVAGMMALFGGSQDLLPVRLTSALIGLATIVVAYAMGKELFNRRIGFLGAALLGTSFWQVMSSRNGYRSITQPLLEGLAVYCFWRARRAGGYRWYLATGAAFAGTTYTYLGGRSFPAVLVAFVLWSLLFEGKPTRAQVKRLLVLAVSAVVAAAPIYAYWLTHPGSYAGRMSQVFIFNPAVNRGDPWHYIWGSIVMALEMFTVRGELMWRYNLPGRPLFEGALAPAFLLGVAIVIWRGWRRRDAAAAMLIVWMLVMLLPNVLSYDPGGYTLRGMGLVPALFLFPALGIDGAWRWLAGRQFVRRPSGAWLKPVLPLAAAAVIVWDAGLTYRDYFVDWSRQFGAAYETDAHVVAEARYLAAEANPDRENVFAGSDYRGHPIIAQLAPKVYFQLRWFDGRYAVVYSPQAERDSRYVLSFTTLPPGKLDRYFPSESLVGLQRFDRGIAPDQPPPKYLAYLLTPQQVQAQVDRWLTDPATTKLAVNYDGQLEVLGAQAPARVTAGEVLPVTVIWRVLEPPRAEDYMFFAHLIDDHGQMYAQTDRNGYPTLEWRRGDVVVGRYDIAVPEDIGPGKYSVDFGLYDRGDKRRLPIAKAPAKSTEVVASVKVLAAEAPAMAKHAVNKTIGNDFQLLGFDVNSTGATGGRRALDVRLLWSALDKPAEDYTVFVQLLSPEGKLIAQSDAMPAGNRFPTSIWEPGDSVADLHRLDLPPSLPAGSYRLIAGMYLLRSGQRLLADGADFVNLTTVTLGP